MDLFRVAVVQAGSVPFDRERSTMKALDLTGQAIRSGARLIVFPEASFFPQRSRICEFAAKHRLPAIHGLRLFVDAGGLMSYGYSLPDQWQRAATYVDKILKGAKPGDLPVQQPTKFEFVINRASRES